LLVTIVGMLDVRVYAEEEEIRGAQVAQRSTTMPFDRQPYEPSTALHGSPVEYRLQVQRAQQERAALRDSELEDQASPMKGPRERIETWERLHALRLPRTPDHLLLKVIATQTGLTVAQVHEEQRRRVAQPLRPAADTPT
jgi:hypothetical protein